MRQTLFFLLLSVFIIACSNQGDDGGIEENYSKPALSTFKVFEGLDKIWYEGKAEVSRYELQQNRYKDIHPGEHILIFVTEDFLTDQQVKNERYRNSNSTPVLKNNQLRKFTTGLYDYSIMTSVFTPTKVNEFPYTEKVTTSAQDWCGHAFMQINKQDEGGYKMHLHSYFEQEADQIKSIPDAILEDEIFNRIRMNPDGIPVGNIRIYPGTLFARLAHKTFQPAEATASMTSYEGEEFQGAALMVYKLYYPSFQRTLEIIFEQAAPHRIEGWIERNPSVFDGQIRRSIAKRTSTEWIDYWSKNSPEDASLRTRLGIEGF